jgi:hypothetical protein
MERAAGLEHEAGQFKQRLLIDVALEFDHNLERHPVVVPAPGIEFGMCCCTQADVAVAAYQAQQKPDLLLAAVVSAQVASDPLVGYLVTQPLARPSDDAAVLCRVSANFLPQFAEHCLLGRFTMLDAALRKLPRMLLDPLTPEDFVLLLSRMMPTFGRYPSLSSMPTLNL